MQSTNPRVQEEQHRDLPFKEYDEQKPKKDWFLTTVAVVGFLFFLFCFSQLNIEYQRLVAGTVEFFDIVQRMFPPDASEWRYVLAAAVQSLQVAILGTVIAIVFSLVLAFFAAENLTPHRAVSAAIKGFATFMRVIPTIVWALIFIVAVGLGPLPGVLAIAIHSLGMLIKMFAQSVEEMDNGKIEALKATGASWIQIIAQGVIPTVLTALMAWSILRLEIDIGESTILGLVGAGGIGWELSRAMRGYHFDQAFFIAFVIFVMIFSVEMLGNRVRVKL